MSGRAQPVLCLPAGTRAGRCDPGRKPQRPMAVSPQSGQRPAWRRSGGRLWYPGHYAEKCSRCGHQLPGVDRARVPTTLHPLRAARPRSVVFPASIECLLCTCCCAPVVRGRRQAGQAAPLPQSACLLACGGAGVRWSPLTARAVKGIRSAQRQHCRLVGFQPPGTLGY